MTTQNRTLSAVEVVGALMFIIVCGGVIIGCGGGGGGGGSAPAPTPTPVVNRTPTINTQPWANPSSAYTTTGGQIVLTLTATDPDGDNITVSWSQTLGNTVNLTTSSSGDTYTAEFATPGSVDTLTFQATVDDGKGHVVTSNDVSINITIYVPPPASPSITSFDYSGLSIDTEANDQKILVKGTFSASGYTASMINVTGGRVLRLVDGSTLLIEVPRQATAGSHSVEFTFTNGANAVSKNLTYTDITTDSFRHIVNYEKGGFSSRINLVTMTNGSLSTVTPSLGAGTDDNIAFCPGADKDHFWILVEDGITVQVRYLNVTTGSLEFTDVELTSDGFAHSIAPLHDGKACVALWTAFGSNTMTMTVVRDTGTADAGIPLNTGGSEVDRADGVTAVQTFLYKETSLSTQDYAMVGIGSQGTNRGLALIRLDTGTYTRTSAGLTINTDRLLVNTDPGAKAVRLTALGNDGSNNIAYQTVLMNPSIASQNFATAVNLLTSTARVSQASFGYTSQNQFILVYVEEGSDTYNFYNTSTNQSYSESFVGVMNIMATEEVSGNAWLAVVASDGTDSTVKLISSPDDIDFAGGSINNNIAPITVTDQANAVSSNPGHLLIETRNGSGNNNIVPIDLATGLVGTLANEPVTDAPTGVTTGDAGMSGSRQACKNLR